MANAKDYFPDLEEMEREQLLLARQEIVSRVREAGGDYASLSDEDLARLLAVNAFIRQKNSGPPKRSPSAKSPATIDDLL